MSRPYCATPMRRCPISHAHLHCSRRWDGNSYYHSFQANLTRRFSNGLQYQGSYTWSRNLDTAATSFASGVVSLNAGGPQNPFYMRAEKGLSPIDPRHQFSSNATYD